MSGGPGNEKLTSSRLTPNSGSLEKPLAVAKGYRREVLPPVDPAPSGGVNGDAPILVVPESGDTAVESKVCTKPLDPRPELTFFLAR